MLYRLHTDKKQVAFLSNPEARTEAEREELRRTVSSVLKLIILPDEEPSLATIRDAKKLAAPQTNSGSKPKRETNKSNDQNQK